MTKFLAYGAAILVLLVLITVHEFGHFIVAKALKVPVKVFSIGFGKALVRWRWNETEMRLAAFPAGGFCAFAEDVADDEPVRPEELLGNRPLGVRALVVSGGVFFNYLFAYLVLLGMIAAQGSVMIMKPMPVTVTSVLPGPAQHAGIQADDQLVAVDGQPVTTSDALIHAVKARPDKPLQLTVRRAGHERTVAVTPNARGKIGVAIEDSRPVQQLVSGPLEAIKAAGDRQWDMTRQIVGGAVQLFTGQVPLRDVSGPVGIVSQTATFAQQDAFSLIPLMAVISIALAIFNFLPFPALDGGHFLFILIEAVARRPLPPKALQAINQAGLVFLMAVILLITVKDIRDLVQPPTAATAVAPTKGTSPHAVQHAPGR